MQAPMRTRNLILGFAALVAVGAAGAIAYAQSAGQTLTNLISTDLVQVYRQGTAAITYASPGQISNVRSYVKVTPATGFSYTFGNGQSEINIRPSGTLAAGYITAAPLPSDGAKECVFSTQTITLLYWNANTGQTINNAVTTLAANTSACYLYSLSNKTWDRD